MFFFKPCQCLCYSICLTPVKCQVNTQWCVYVAIAPSWWATKHPHFHTNLPPKEIPFIATRRTNDAHRINSSVDPVHQWLQRAVFWKEEQKKRQKTMISMIPSKKGNYCIFCTKNQASLPSSKHQQLPETFKPYSFFYSISKDPKRNVFMADGPSYKGYLKLAGLFCSTKKCPNQAQP